MAVGLDATTNSDAPWPIERPSLAGCVVILGRVGPPIGVEGFVGLFEHATAPETAKAITTRNVMVREHSTALRKMCMGMGVAAHTNPTLMPDWPSRSLRNFEEICDGLQDCDSKPKGAGPNFHVRYLEIRP